MGRIKRVLVGINGSDHSIRAVKKAVEIAATQGASITLMYVVPELPEIRSSARMIYPGRAEAVERMVDGAKKSMEERNIGYEVLVRRGDPASTLLNHSEDYDLIAVGTRGEGYVPELLRGSVAAKVMHRSKVPVILVP